MVPVTTPRLDWLSRGLINSTGLKGQFIPDGFFWILTGFFVTINEIREVKKTIYTVNSDEKRICCDLLRSGSARAEERHNS
jgi:hypothetical protein